MVFKISELRCDEYNFDRSGIFPWYKFNRILLGQTCLPNLTSARLIIRKLFDRMKSPERLEFFCEGLTSSFVRLIH